MRIHHCAALCDTKPFYLECIKDRMSERRTRPRLGEALDPEAWFLSLAASVEY